MKTIFKMSFAVAAFLLVSCGGHEDKKMEQLTYDEQQTISDSLGNSLKGNQGFNQLVTAPNSVLATGMDRYRLVPIYKIRKKADRNIDLLEGTTYSRPSTDENGNRIPAEEDDFRYFMPGMDMVYGYNMVNVAHYDMQTGKLSYFFDRPALIRAVYFPGIKKDSLKKAPVSRNFFLVSAYDEDTNRDSLINKKDLRRIYHIDEANTKKTELLPKGYSSIRSTYDYKNDVMYIYARFDANKNGRQEPKEPVSIFFINLANPSVAKRMI